jgi:hypothetical protein
LLGLRTVKAIHVLTLDLTSLSGFGFPFFLIPRAFGTHLNFNIQLKPFEFDMLSFLTAAALVSVTVDVGRAAIIPVTGVYKNGRVQASRFAPRADLFGTTTLNDSQDLSYLTNMCVSFHLSLPAGG